MFDHIPVATPRRNARKTIERAVPTMKTISRKRNAGGMSQHVCQTRLGANFAQGSAWLLYQPECLAQVAIMFRSPRPYDSEIRTLRFPSHAVHPAHALRGTMTPVCRAPPNIHQSEDNL